jgi:hypothetical protein
MELVEKEREKEPFPKTDIIQYIENEQKQTGERYRVCDLAVPVTNSDAYFFIENINGYHPAKLRTFQDIMDIMCGGSTSNVTHPFMWNIMNAKYIITRQQLQGGAQPFFQSKETGAYVYYNGAYCKRAFFVDSVKVADDYAILNDMNENKFNPKEVAYVEKELAQKVEPSGQYAAETRAMLKQMAMQNGDSISIPDSLNGENEFVPTAKITDYKNEYIGIETETKAPHLLVLSEMYYPLWKAYIDGQETEIYKTDFAFRSVVVPAGKHKVEFKYHSNAFATGKTLSAISNVVVILALIAGIILEIRRRKKIVTTQE